MFSIFIWKISLFKIKGLSNIFQKFKAFSRFSRLIQIPGILQVGEHSERWTWILGVEDYVRAVALTPSLRD